jgi:lipopolysaccharide export system permease protein
MKIIDRYILKQYLVPFGYILGTFSLLYIILDLFDRFSDFVAVKADALDILLYYGYFLFKVNGFVPFLVMVLPIAMLLATLYTLTLFARHNELTAMCASGVSLRRLMVPLMVVGLLASLFGAVVQETIGPVATRWIANYTKQVLKRSSDSSFVVRDYLYHSGTANRQWLIKELDQRTPTVLKGVKVTHERPDRSLVREITADRAEWMDGSWWFYGVRQRDYNEKSDPVGAQTEVLDKPIEMTDYDEQPDDFINELKDVDFLSTADMVRSIQKRPDVSGRWLAKRLTDINSRVAMPWSCLVLILLGLPAALGGGRQSAMRSVAFGVVALFAFYVLIQMGMILGKRELISPWLAGWLPNLTFLGIGGWLTWRLR